jgi:protein O-mannosyl-transferase
MKRRLHTGLRPYIWLLCNILLASIAYRRLLTAGFLDFGDNLYVSANPVVLQGLTTSGIRWAFSSLYAATWQPLVWISYMLDVSLLGKTPSAFHFSNLLLHVLNVSLVFILVKRLTKATSHAAIASLLLAIHPVHVESVAWIVERKGLLSVSFALLAMLAYHHHRTTRKIWSYVASLCALALGLMTSAMLITLPVLLYLLDAPYLPKGKHATPCSNHIKDLRQRIPFVLLALGATCITLYARHSGDPLLAMGEISFWQHSAYIVISISRYLWHFAYPVRLAVFYPYPAGWSAARAVPALLAFGSLAWLLVKHQTRSRLWIWGFAWFFAALLPAILFHQFGWHSMSDRFVYLPAIGMYIAGAYTIMSCYEKNRIVTTACGIAIITAMLSVTTWQTGHWQDNIALFSRAVEVTRKNWIMQNSLGAALSHAGRHAEAIPHFTESARINPRNATALFNLGHVHFVQGEWDLAATFFEQSLSVQDHFRARYNLAVTHARRGDVQAAKRTYLRLLETHPGHTLSLLNLGKLYRETGQYDQAMACYRIVMQNEPGHKAARTGLAVTMLAKAQDNVAAIGMLVQLLQEDAGNKEARDALNRALQAP